MKRTKVEIDGMTFQVVGNDDSAYVETMAEELTAKIEEIRNGNFRLNQVQSLILTALNLLDERNKAISQLEELSKESPQKTQELENLEEIARLQEELKKKTKEQETWTRERELSASRLAHMEDTLRENSEKLNAALEEGRGLKERLEELEEERKKLEEIHFEAQRQIVDLNKDIAILNGDEDK